MTSQPAMLTREEAAAEVRRLYTECAAALGYANAALQAAGMESESFRRADRNAIALWQRLREVQEVAARPRLA